jgi:hypothetical protein
VVKNGYQESVIEIEYLDFIRGNRVQCDAMHASDPQESTHQSQLSAVSSRVLARMQRLHLPSYFVEYREVGGGLTHRLSGF